MPDERRRGCDDKFGCRWARPRTWEQKARHRGVCLLFDRIRLDAVLEAVLEDREAFHVDDVRYTEARIAGRPARRGGRRLHRDTPGLLLPQEERLPD